MFQVRVKSHSQSHRLSQGNIERRLNNEPREMILLSGLFASLELLDMPSLHTIEVSLLLHLTQCAQWFFDGTL